MNTRARAVSRLVIGVDTGGTFTDIVVAGDGRSVFHKLASTPDDPARAVIEGLAAALARFSREPGTDTHTSDRRTRRARLDLVHGTTVATNTVLESKGARTGFITTAGFRDLIEIGRQNRPELYDLSHRRAEPLVPRRLRLELDERILADGVVARAPAAENLRRIVASLRGRVDSVAVGLLFSGKNPAHERLVAGALSEALAGVPVTLSSEISPEFREYERFSTAVLNAYVAPRMERYLGRLERELAVDALEIMGSGGGTIPVARARVEPLSTVLSGPAAGVLGACRQARRVGVERIITFDMGGTSTDVALADGAPTYRNESRIRGLPFRLPILDVHTVGAGGGSIARLDAGGGLRVGPQSAGADPGPAIYGRGDALTVTDAHVFLGHLAADSFLGGGMQVFPERAGPLVQRLAAAAGIAPPALAHGVLRVVNAEMQRAIRVVSQQRGHDPRRFALVAFGGASGLHAAELARALLIPRVIVPPHPGLLCAAGMLDADRVRWRARTVQATAAALPAARLDAIARELLAEAAADFEGVRRRLLEEHLELDLRFLGQTHVLTVAFSAPASRSGQRRRRRNAFAGYEEEFRRRYRERFEFFDPGWTVEVVAVRVALRLRRRRDADSAPCAEERPARRSRKRRPPPLPEPRFRPVTLATGGRRRTPVYDRSRLEPGSILTGPAIVADYSSTTLCPRGWRLEVDGAGNLVMAGGP